MREAKSDSVSMNVRRAILDRDGAKASRRCKVDSHFAEKKLTELDIGRRSLELEQRTLT